MCQNLIRSSFHIDQYHVKIWWFQPKQFFPYRAYERFLKKNSIFDLEVKLLIEGQIYHIRKNFPGPLYKCTKFGLGTYNSLGVIQVCFGGGDGDNHTKYIYSNIMHSIHTFYLYVKKSIKQVSIILFHNCINYYYNYGGKFSYHYLVIIKWPPAGGTYMYLVWLSPSPPPPKHSWITPKLLQVPKPNLVHL